MSPPPRPLVMRVLSLGDGEQNNTASPDCMHGTMVALVDLQLCTCVSVMQVHPHVFSASNKAGLQQHSTTHHRHHYRFRASKRQSHSMRHYDRDASRHDSLISLHASLQIGPVAAS
jgi:hypothetical protein